jgi:hypothetical protein
MQGRREYAGPASYGRARGKTNRRTCAGLTFDGASAPNGQSWIEGRVSSLVLQVCGAADPVK